MNDRQRERRRELARARYARNPEKYRNKAAAWRAANTDKYLAICRRSDKKRYLRSQEYLRAWWKTPRGRLLRKRTEQRRRAKKLATYTPLGTTSDMANVLRASGGVCVYCERRETFWNRITIDHVVPLAMDGHDAPYNWIAACKSCNSSKHNEDAQAWILRRFGDGRWASLKWRVEEAIAAHKRESVA